MICRICLTFALSNAAFAFLVAGLAVGPAPGQQYEPKYKRQNNGDSATALKDYEYVIVGSGPGGGPLVARLAIAGHRVLLLEAGDDNGADLNQQVPELK